MPNRETHLGIGFGIVFVLYFFFNSYLGIENIEGYAFVGAFLGSILPDILNPPTSYKHRGFFHSKQVRKYTGIVSIGVLFVFITPVFNLITFFCLGYFLHLLADSTTPMGLPD